MKGKVGFFAVAKKDGSQRLIVDGREPSSCHHHPPHTELGTVSSLSGLDLGSASDPHGATLDLVDGFYQHTNRRMGSWFCCPWPESAEFWGVDSYYDEDLGRLVDCSPDTPLFFCFEGLAMGWSWGLYFCQASLERSVRLGLARAFGHSGQTLKDKRPSPLLAVGSPVSSVYVDNAIVLGCDK